MFRRLCFHSTNSSDAFNSVFEDFRSVFKIKESTEKRSDSADGAVLILSNLSLASHDVDYSICWLHFLINRLVSGFRCFLW